MSISSIKDEFEKENKRFDKALTRAFNIAERDVKGVMRSIVKDEHYQLLVRDYVTTISKDKIESHDGYKHFEKLLEEQGYGLRCDSISKDIYKGLFGNYRTVYFKIDKFVNRLDELNL